VTNALTDDFISPELVFNDIDENTYKDLAPKYWTVQLDDTSISELEQPSRGDHKFTSTESDLIKAIRSTWTFPKPAEFSPSKTGQPDLNRLKYRKSKLMPPIGRFPMSTGSIPSETNQHDLSLLRIQNYNRIPPKRELPMSTTNQPGLMRLRNGDDKPIIWQWDMPKSTQPDLNRLRYRSYKRIIVESVILEYAFSINSEAEVAECVKQIQFGLRPMDPHRYIYYQSLQLSNLVKRVYIKYKDHPIAIIVLKLLFSNIDTFISEQSKELLVMGKNPISDFESLIIAKINPDELLLEATKIGNESFKQARYLVRSMLNDVSTGLDQFNTKYDNQGVAGFSLLTRAYLHGQLMRIPQADIIKLFPDVWESVNQTTFTKFMIRVLGIRIQSDKQREMDKNRVLGGRIPSDIQREKDKDRVLGARILSDKHREKDENRVLGARILSDKQREKDKDRVLGARIRSDKHREKDENRVLGARILSDKQREKDKNRVCDLPTTAQVGNGRLINSACKTKNSMSHAPAVVATGKGWRSCCNIRPQ
jgi:hypothetical protein